MTAISSRVSILVVLSVLLFSSLQAPTAAGPAADTFVAATRNQPTTLDPHIGTDNPSLKFLMGAYEPLLRNRYGTLDDRNLEGVLAQSWEVSGDGLRYVFRLRSGVRFHDGSLLDAESVKLSIERMKAINLGNAYVLSAVNEVRALDASTVQITLVEPYAPFLQALSIVYIASAQSIRDRASGGDWARAWFRDHEAGTGPYELQSWELGQQISLRAFPAYWRGWPPGRPRGVVLRVVPEDSTQRLLVQSGQVDWADTIAIDDAVALRQNQAVRVQTVPALGPHYLMMNTRRAPLNNVKVRQALVAAFPYDQFVRHVMRGLASMPSGYIAPAFPEHDGEPEAAFDIDRARTLVREAGLERGSVSLTLAYFNARDYQNIGAQLYVAQLQKLGVTLKLEGMPFASILRRMSDSDPTQQPDFAFIQVAPSFASPDAILYPTFHSQSKHWGHYTYVNPRVDTLLDRARFTLNVRQRTQLYQQVQRILREDAPGVPVMLIHTINVYSARVKHVDVLPVNGAVINYYTIQLGN